MRVEELQLAGVMRMHEHRQYLAAEQARQHVDMGGVDLNGAFSRARGPERRRPPRSGIVAAAPAFSFLIFFFDFGFDFTRPLVFSRR